MTHISHLDEYPHPASKYAVPESALGLAMNAPDLPEIVVTAEDSRRLARLVGDPVHIRDRQIAFLARELDRASIVDPDDIHRGIVTMRSLVEFSSGDDNTLSYAILVYPAEASFWENTMSILTPVGTALLGLSEGQSMPYEAADGGIRWLSVHRVLFQPEAAGMPWV